MKNAFILILAFTAFTVRAQININLTGTNTNVSGTTQNYELTDAVSSHSMIYFDVINSSGVAVDLMLTRKIISETAGWSNYLCWGPAPFGVCYPANSDLVWNTSIESIVDTAKISTYVTAPTAGGAHYRYYVSEGGVNYLDSVDILVNSVASINSIDFMELQVFPNPTVDVLNIKNAMPCDYTLMNSIGIIILNSEEKVSNHQIDTSFLPAGIYIIRLESNGIFKTEKIQIR